MLQNRYNFNSQTGQFRERITIRRVEITKDRIGQNIKTETDFGSYWAMIKTYVNRNVTRNDFERTQEDIRFVIKYSKGLSDLIYSDGTVFDIIHNSNRYRIIEATNDNELNKTVTIRGELLK